MAGVEGQLEVCPSKRKAETFAGDECSLEDHVSNKRINCSEVEKQTAAPAVAADEGKEAAGDEGNEAPVKKMWRLPQEEVDWIIARKNEPVDPELRALKRANPSLLPSPEEEKDKSLVLLYECARDCYEDEEKFAKFQAWVRCEYNSKGFVEVDYDYFGERAEAIRLSNEARDEVFKDYDLSSDSEDDYVWKLVKRKVRSFF